MRDQVFISYSHRDARWLERLQVYLAPLERRGRIRHWDDTLITPGQLWEREIAAALERTRVAILLVSADFLASDFIARVELPRLLGAAEDRGVLIIPVVLDHCNFDRCAELAQFQAINSPARPLDTLGEPEYKAILAKLAAAVDDALGEATAARPAVAPARLVGLPARNPLFSGRAQVLETLSAVLQRNCRAALCGLPGLGKTETAIEFAQRRRQSYEWVLWSRADSEQQVISGYCAFATAFGLPEASGADQLAAARAAHAALSARRGTLLILDAAEDLGVVRRWLPEGDGVHVLLTARSAAVGGLAEPIELEPLEQADAIEFLLRRSRITGTAETAGSDEAALAAARDVAQAAAGFPLALDQAGAYIEETGCSLQEYAALWREHSRQLLAERGQGSLRQDDSLLQAWSLSLQQLEAASPAAAALLRLLAFCHSDALPESALSAAGLSALPLVAQLADPLARNTALREALRFAFLRRDAKTRRLTMHRLVQQFIREGMTYELQREWCTHALTLLDGAFPRPRFVTWRDCDALAAHVLSLQEHAVNFDLAPPALGHVARLSCELGGYFMQRARYTEAERLIAHALTLRRATPEHITELARALAIDGQLQLVCGRLDKAAERLNEATALLIAQPTVELVSVFDLLGKLELARNNFDAAEGWLGKAQVAAEAASAQRSSEAAQCINDLGAVRFRRGDYAGARTAFEQAAALRREVLPPEHPSVAQSLNNLAVVCMRLNERAAARMNYLEALRLREAALGSHHPDIAESLVSMALLDLKDGKLESARASLTRAETIQLTCRGPLHPDLVNVQACLADVAIAEGKLDDAHRLYSVAHAARLKMLGADHPETARMVLGLADVCRARGDLSAAATAMEEALPVLQRHLNSNHPDVTACEQDLRQLREALHAQEAAAHRH